MKQGIIILSIIAVVLIFGILFENMKVQNVDAPAKPILKVEQPDPPSSEGWKQLNGELPKTSTGYMVENK